jgi:pyruvate,water dikinase
MKRVLELFGYEKACIPLKQLEGKHAERYAHFRELLDHNHRALSLMAEMEEIYYGGKPFSLQAVRQRCEGLLSSVKAIIPALQQISRKEFPYLEARRETFEREVREEFNVGFTSTSEELVLALGEITQRNLRAVGNKAGNLGIMRNVLHLPVPEGFVVTARAFDRFVEENGLREIIDDVFARLDPESPESLTKASEALKLGFEQGKIPEDVTASLLKAYEALEKRTRPGVRIAMRSSAAREDTEATFAGQYETVLNVTPEGLLDAYKQVLSSKYSPRAISYRMQYGLDDRETPMSVAGLAMVDAQSSGVIYTRDPADPSSKSVKINAIWGLGEMLVAGSTSPDVILVHRDSGVIVERSISLKETQLVNAENGGILLAPVAKEDQERPAIDDQRALKLFQYALRLEEHFGGPQDIEWAMDNSGELFVLQSRPLAILTPAAVEDKIEVDDAAHPILLSGGAIASPGVAAGRVWVVKDDEEYESVPEDAVLVAPTASPNYARAIHKIRGIVTDMGSVTSHLASVAREFGVPAIVDTKRATSVLQRGQWVTLWAGNRTVYEGNVEALVRGIRRTKRLMFESPGHLRLGRILEHITPLNLRDPQSPDFSPLGCKTLHDIVRFAHEQGMKAMFGYGEVAEKMPNSVKLTGNIPLLIHLIDLGGGLREGLTTCDVVTSDSVRSIPFSAVWKGFIHPGVTWTGAIDVTPRNVVSLIASSMTAGMEGPPGAIAYALMSEDYLNLSARFGYHFATLDTLCGDNPEHNYVALQFSGGAGPVYGRVLRVQFLGKVLQRLGFEVTLTGDLLEASLNRHDRASTEEKIDQMGRLLACSHLLDMAIRTQEDVDRLVESFFRGEYNLLARKAEGEPEAFYIHGGHWRVADEGGKTICVQDGSQWGIWLGPGVASVMGKMMGSKYQEFLDNIGAYYYFPLAIAKESWIASGKAGVKVKPVDGSIDRAGGLAFGIKDINNYFVLRINALEGNVILFEFVRAKRIQRVSVERPIDSNRWYDLSVELRGNELLGLLDDEVVIRYTADRSLDGYVGLWTKADSVTAFDGLVTTTDETRRTYEF